jgi:preprotein translocase subunit SecA
MQVGVNLRKAYESECREIVTEFEKVIMLMLIDEAWKNHLRDMDELKQSVQNAVYEQKDPLVVYKMESFNLFERMLSELNSEAVGMLFQGTIPVQEADEVREQRQVVRAPQPALQANKPAYTSSSSAAPQAALQPGMPQAPAPHVSPVHVGPKVGRNDPCPCGSGKKFKSCHGKEEA